jgi:energy-coupling factor transport system permease protein
MSHSEFELLGQVPIGQYLPTGSLLHHLDPRIKVVALLLLVGLATFTSSLMGQGLLFLALLYGFHLGRVSTRWAFAAVRGMLPFLLLLALLQVVSVPARDPRAVELWRWKAFQVTDRSIMAGLLLLLRFATMVYGLGLFSLTTTTSEMTHGIEHLLSPGQRLGLPAHELALVFNIAIRYLPMVASDAERLLKAQASRGTDLGTTGANLLTRTRRLLPLLVPLFLSSLRSAEELTEAMEARGYLGGKGRTHLLAMHAQARDMQFLASVVVLAVAVIACDLAHVDSKCLYFVLIR